MTDTVVDADTAKIETAVSKSELITTFGAWQPIETAPRDQRLLLWNGTGMYCGHWAKSIETDDEAWIIAEYGNEGDQLLIKATHWMPLPLPPST